MEKTLLAEEMLHAIGKDMDFFWENAHPDLVLEFPYGPSVGMPDRVTRRENTEPYLCDVARILPGLTYTNVRVLPLAEPDAFVLEYGGTCPAANDYDQIYIAIMRFKDDKLILFREYWDSTEVSRALGAAVEEFVGNGPS